MAYENIVVLTGAGVSAESGVRTFRDNGGLWEEHRVEDVATPEAFLRDPALVQRFYNLRRALLGTVEPNAAHIALGRLQAKHKGTVTIITQNVVI
jgi:NAD-dependent deacetylase